MNDLEGLADRLTAALGRIETGIAKSDDGTADASMAEALDAERTANAQLEERVRAIKTKQEAMASAFESKIKELQDALEAREREIADMGREVEDARDRERRLAETNDALRSAHTALRAAAESAVVEPQLVNGSMSAELDALSEARRSDRAELDGLIAALAPLVEQSGSERG